jgi:hypothetical protein
MSEKALCYVVSVKELESIPEKDRILLAHFNEMDWTVIVGKDDFQVGDKAIYVEVNTVLPVREEFEFLRKRCYSPGRDGFVIKSMKMGNTYSQGLAFPLTTFRKTEWGIVYSISIGCDVTELLGAKAIEDAEVKPGKSVISYSKWERFIDKWFYLLFKKRWIKKTSSDFPSELISKTDETQVQNLGYVYEAWKNRKYYSTVKMDGSSLTVVVKNGRFIVASRNTRLFDAKLGKAAKMLTPEHKDRYETYLYAIAKSGIARTIARIPSKSSWTLRNIGIQGELCGPGVQKNRIGLKDLEWYVFNIKDLKTGKYFSYPTMEDWADRLDLKLVPLLDECEIWNFKNLDELREYAKGEYPSGHPREGVVFRLYDAYDEIYVADPLPKMANMASLKIINEDFRIKVEGKD